MSWTYSGNPASSPVDEVHHLLGDDDPSQPVASDEECAYALEANKGNTYLAAADIAETKALHFVNRPALTKRGDRTTAYTFQYQGYQALALALRLRASIKFSSAYAGGIDVLEKWSQRHDLKSVQPAFTNDLHTTRPWRGWEDEMREP